MNSPFKDSFSPILGVHRKFLHVLGSKSYTRIQLEPISKISFEEIFQEFGHYARRLLQLIREVVWERKPTMQNGQRHGKFPKGTFEKGSNIAKFEN
jgi:hypothetical protein